MKKQDPSQGRLFEEEMVSSDLRQFDTRRGGIRMVDPGSLLPNPLVPCVIYVPHYLGREVKMGMAGKVVPHPEDGLVFFHAHSGSQVHYKTDCPAPVDSILVAALAARNLRWVYVYDRKRKAMLAGLVEELGRAPEEVWDNRRRRYLPSGCWIRRAPVEEVQEGRSKVYRWGNSVLLTAPHLKYSVTLAEGG